MKDILADYRAYAVGEAEVEDPDKVQDEFQRHPTPDVRASNRGASTSKGEGHGFQSSCGHAAIASGVERGERVYTSRRMDDRDALNDHDLHDDHDQLDDHGSADDRDALSNGDGAPDAFGAAGLDPIDSDDIDDFGGKPFLTFGDEGNSPTVENSASPENPKTQPQGPRRSARTRGSSTIPTINFTTRDKGKKRMVESEAGEEQQELQNQDMMQGGSRPKKTRTK